MVTTAAKLKAASTGNVRKALLAALDFAAVAISKDDNSGLAAYVTVKDGLLMSENETFAVGMPVDTPLDMALHGEKLQAALEQCGDNFQMVQVGKQELSITSGKFRAVIPILETEMVRQSTPDEWIGIIHNDLANGFKAVSKGCTGKGDRTIHQCVHLQANSITSTNGGFAIEFWHGIDLPQNLLIPKKSVDAITKLEKSMRGFGYNPDISATFYYDDYSFIRTRLYAGEWPSNMRTLFDQNMQGEFVPLWDGFAPAMKALHKFVEDDRLFFHDGKLATGKSLEHCASYDVPTLRGQQAFAESYWRALLPYIKQVKLGATAANPTAFIGSNIRGLIMGKTW
jgi:hypothetical protein